MNFILLIKKLYLWLHVSSVQILVKQKIRYFFANFFLCYIRMVYTKDDPTWDYIFTGGSVFFMCMEKILFSTCIVLTILLMWNIMFTLVLLLAYYSDSCRFYLCEILKSGKANLFKTYFGNPGGEFFGLLGLLGKKTLAGGGKSSG